MTFAVSSTELIMMYSIRRQINTLHRSYNAKTFRKEKVKNKLQLQRDLGLNEDPKAMLIGIVSRLTDQKGFDLIAYIMDELCQDAVQIVVLGTGEERYENMFRHFDWKYHGKVSAQIYYDEPMSHQNLCSVRCIPDAIIV